MESLKNSRFLLGLTILILFIINVLQGYLTELLPDEAYYWVYSQDMDWGFFDHPPMVAVYIKLSSFLFNDELGVRFMSSLMFSVIMYMVWLLIDHPKKKEFTWLYLLLFLSTCLLNVFGFITTPDTPLTFFFILFLVGYQKYLKTKSLISYTLLCISIAGMMYSKYQGILVIIFVVFSNWKLIKDYKLWIVVFCTFLLYLPHLYWQYDNNFASIRYHLFDRNVNNSYKFEYTYMHLVNAIVIIGFTFPFFYKALFKGLKTKDLFHKSLNYIVLGFLIFFLIMSFRDHVQAQWIVSISIPLIYITFFYLVENKTSRLLFIKVATFTILCVLFLRIYLMNDQLLPKQLEVHKNREWVRDLDKKLEGRTALFLNSYQNTSLYWFYSGKRPCQYNSFWGRKNQYDLIKNNQKCMKNNLVHVSIKYRYTTDSIFKRDRSIYLNPVESYHSLLLLNFEIKDNIKLHEGKNSVDVENLDKYGNLDLNNLSYTILFFSKQKKLIGSSTKATLTFLGDGNHGKINFHYRKNTNKEIGYFQVLATSNKKVIPQRVSSIIALKKD